MENNVRARINPPSLSNDALSYQTECQFALEPSIRGLLNKAEEVGWDRKQALIALLSLSSEMLEGDTEIAPN